MFRLNWEAWTAHDGGERVVEQDDLPALLLGAVDDVLLLVVHNDDRELNIGLVLSLKPHLSHPYGAVYSCPQPDQAAWDQETGFLWGTELKAWG